MSKIINTIVAIALVSLFPALSLYAGTQGQVYTRDQAVMVAEDFIKESPTYSFDGIKDSIEIVNVESTGTSWYVSIKFTSRHAGYGDRTGEMVAQVLTDHIMVIHVSEGKVVSAVTDDVFDEITCTVIETPQDIEEAEETTLEWLRDAPTFSYDGIQGTMEIVDTVILESYPEQYVVTISFACGHPGYGNRSDMVLAQVITEHTAVLTVVNNEVQSAVIDGEWDELNQREKVVSELLPPEMALDIAVQYLRENYPKASDLEITDDWSVTDMTPEDLLGVSVTRYIGDGWNITLQHPVVWKPAYTLNVENTETGFTWSGTVDQSGNVHELTD
jgi:hypothetical protein